MTCRTLNGRSGASHTARSQQVGVAVALLACVGLAACTGAETPPPHRRGEPRTVAPLPDSGDLDAGTYLVTGFTVPFEVTVPAGWETGDGANLFKEDPNHPGDGGSS